MIKQNTQLVDYLENLFNYFTKNLKSPPGGYTSYSTLSDFFRGT